MKQLSKRVAYPNYGEPFQYPEYDIEKWQMIDRKISLYLKAFPNTAEEKVVGKYTKGWDDKEVEIYMAWKKSQKEKKKLPRVASVEPTIGLQLTSAIHKNFTMTADDMLKEGIIENEEERISLSNAIGEALSTFRENVDPALYNRQVYETTSANTEEAEETTESFNEEDIMKKEAYVRKEDMSFDEWKNRLKRKVRESWEILNNMLQMPLLAPGDAEKAKSTLHQFDLETDVLKLEASLADRVIRTANKLREYDAEEVAIKLEEAIEGRDSSVIVKEAQQVRNIEKLQNAVDILAQALGEARAYRNISKLAQVSDVIVANTDISIEELMQTIEKLIGANRNANNTLSPLLSQLQILLSNARKQSPAATSVSGKQMPGEQPLATAASIDEPVMKQGNDFDKHNE